MGRAGWPKSVLLKLKAGKLVFLHSCFFMGVAIVNQRRSADTDRTVSIFLAKCNVIQDYRLRSRHFTRKIGSAYFVTQCRYHVGADNIVAVFPCFQRCLNKASFETVSALSPMVAHHF